ncbi:MAG: hypothetical protein DWQ34_01335 [Planctomycetota bacterium]|nr:MAG: hypothetical protein DWQ29_21625 [Planctomycetota bacterium]REJ97717.1 MAG: hypothetical protein DWQ34_01335 [Planctomycetota bacterium]REK26669.1 MAG: hypothetical protein DWQ41_08945 [Planctomycetota bacterium]REK35672.1 MAG: hypothetical protein DWQ45_11010 [Planctomycetota bacterium]
MNRTQIFADSADQHGFRRVFLTRRQHRDRIDSGAQDVDTQENNQRKSVPSVVIRVPFESLEESLDRGSRDVCKRQGWKPVSYTHLDRVAAVGRRTPNGESIGWPRLD